MDPKVTPNKDLAKAQIPHHNEPIVGTLTLREIFRLLKVYKYFIGSITIMSISVTALHDLFSTAQYKTSVVINVAPDSSLKSMTDVTGYFRHEDMMLSKMNALGEYFKSQDLANKVLSDLIEEKGNVPLIEGAGINWFLGKLGLTKPLTVEQAMQKMPRITVASRVMSFLKAQNNFTNNTFTIESTAADPEIAAFLANSSAKALLEINHSVSLKMVVEVKRFLHNQAADLGQKLKELESSLTSFQSKNQILSLEEAERTAYNSIDRSEQALTETEVRLGANEKLVEHVKKEMVDVRNSIGSGGFSGSHLYLAQLQHRLSMLQYQYALAKPDSEEGKKINSEISELTSTYKKTLSSGDAIKNVIAVSPLQYYNSLENALLKLTKDQQQLRSDLEILRKTSQQSKAKIPKLAVTTQQINDLKRNIQLTSELYLAIRKKIQETEIQEAGTINDISIVSEAPVPDIPHMVPLLVKVGFAAFVGLFFSTLVVLIREAVIPTVRNRRDLEKFGLLILAEVPAVTGVETPNKNIVILRDCPISYEADVYRSMRMRLLKLEKLILNKPEKPATKNATVLMMTSPRGGNGKTFTAVNLSNVLAKGQYKTLLVDLDLRNPSVRDYYPNAKKDVTIDNLILNPAKIDKSKIVNNIGTNLDVAFGYGNVTNPAEKLDSSVVHNFIEQFRKEYDYIIIDAPPALGVIDSQMIIPNVDMVIFVTEHRRTHREDVHLAVHMLKDNHQKPLLAVINFVHREFTYYDTLRYYEYRIPKDKPESAA
ncbi:MAG: AAA family ATPase [Oligoflexia bacterium]|nr:AAA family ATPase [Oligoflexia bacterium]